MALHIFTYYTSNEKAMFMMKTAEMHGVKVHNLWDGRPWGGLQDKLITMHEKLKTLDKTDVVCFIDAYDVIVNADAETMLQSFKDADCDFLLSAETNLDPARDEFKDYPESPTIFRYVNTGVYIGYVHAILHSLEYGSYLGMNDQEYMHGYYLKNYKTKNIKLDTGGKFVLSMYKVPWDSLVIHDGFIHYEDFQTRPCIVHFNGMSYLDVMKDYKHSDGKMYFDYHAVYGRTFNACIGAKMLTKNTDTICKLTGRGSTY